MPAPTAAPSTPRAVTAETPNHANTRNTLRRSA
jgi:hypothetical protein